MPKGKKHTPDQIVAIQSQVEREVVAGPCRYAHERDPGLHRHSRHQRQAVLQLARH